MEATTPAVQEGLSALGHGRFAAARDFLERALELCREDERALVRERLASACFALEDYEAGLLHAYTAFRLYRQAGEARRAAFTGILIANIRQNMGDEAAQRAWLSRARRLLEDEGPCLEAGYLSVATSACDVLEIEDLLRQTQHSLAIAREFGDTDLEVRALADGGLALVACGRVRKGLDWLDEAMAAIVAGEVGNYVFAAKSCCAMMHACDRLGDVERASEWTRAVTDYARLRFGDPPPPILLSHCQIAVGSLLAETGHWDEAEVALRRGGEISRAMQKRAEANGRLAELCVRRGRVLEAEELLRGFEDAPSTAFAWARLHLARDDFELADGAIRRGLRQLNEDLPAKLRLLALQAEVLVRGGRSEEARRIAGEAVEIAKLLGAPGLLAVAHLAAGRAAAATSGEDAISEFSLALRALGEADRPVLRAEIRLELATNWLHSDPRSAIGEAEVALTVFRRLNLKREADRAAALLRELGVGVRLGGSTVGDASALTRREREVLGLLADGLSNAEIGRRLFITSRTAEHHVASILDKLGLKRRSEAAAYAVQLGQSRVD
jgi:DNA-binding CsgD family transcriptional regulator